MKMSVIIPTHNEEDNILDCISAILSNSQLPDEIIVSDSASTDNTNRLIEISSLEALIPIKLINAKKKGRGFQIREGVDASSGDIVVILHADGQISENTISTIHAAFLNSSLNSACLTQNYDSMTLFFKVIIFLNRIRVQLFNISFGDQVQIFRKSALSKTGGFPNIALMEDVEISRQMRPLGRFKILDSVVTCSTRRWTGGHKKKNRLFHTLFVIGIVIWFLLLRRFGKHYDWGNRFYQMYYGI